MNPRGEPAKPGEELGSDTFPASESSPRVEGGAVGAAPAQALPPITPLPAPCDGASARAAHEEATQPSPGQEALTLGGEKRAAEPVAAADDVVVVADGVAGPSQQTIGVKRKAEEDIVPLAAAPEAVGEVQEAGTEDGAVAAVQQTRHEVAPLAAA